MGRPLNLSVTINLPNNVTEELVNELYVTAWRREGCKGCTVYRDGSRGGVLVSTEKKQNEEVAPSLPLSRPQELEVVWSASRTAERWIAFVGLKDSQTFEIFTGLNDEDEGILVLLSLSIRKDNKKLRC